MFWIGLTGGIGTGKSTVTNILTKNGETVIDADKIARKIIQPEEAGYQQIVSYFGLEILNTNSNEIDRNKLAELIFNDDIKKNILEQIIHPLVKQEVQKQKMLYFQNGVKRLFYDVPLLFEKNMESEFDLVVLVYASVQDQKKRLILRNAWNSEQIESRLSSQINIEDKKIKSHFIINNDSTIENLEREVGRLIKFLDEKSSNN